MKHLATASLIAFALGSSSTLALDLGNGFSILGDVELEYLTDGDDDVSFAFADVTFGWRSQAGGQIGFGLDLTLQNFSDLDNGEGRTATWAALVVTTGYGDVAIGRPQPVLERFFDAPEMGGTHYPDVLFGVFGGYGGSFIAQVALFEDADMVGVTFQGEASGLTYGAGVHRIDSTPSDVNAYELAVGYKAGGVELFGGFERIDTPVEYLDRLQLGARYDADRWAVGAHHQSLDFVVTNFEVSTLYADYKVTDALTLGVQAQHFDTGPASNDFYGLSGEYSFGPGGFAQLGYLKAAEGIEDVFSASVGYRF
ncbi:MAG: porin [Tabrizicola sp.]|jgi:hypothetical protein|nr:porin [Tabrizicola sp.]